VALRDVGAERKTQLALSPPRPPFAETLAEAGRPRGSLSFAVHHGLDSMQCVLCDGNDLTGNCGTSQI